MLHQPVLLERSLALLSPALTKNNALVVDATLGAGGHSYELLSQFPNLHLIGIDRDLTAIDHAKSRLAEFDGRITLVHAIYDQMPNDNNNAISRAAKQKKLLHSVH